PADRAVLSEIDATALGDVVVIGREAGIDLRESRGLGIVYRHLLSAGVERRVLREPVRRPFFAERRLRVRWPMTRGNPHTTLFINGAAPRFGPSPPDHLVVEMRRRRTRRQRRRCRNLHFASRVLERVHPHERVVELTGPPDRTVRV